MAEPNDLPQVRYEPDGDMIEVILTGEMYVGEVVGPHLVIHRGRETGAVVGVTIERTHRMMFGRAMDQVASGETRPLGDVEGDLRGG